MADPPVLLALVWHMHQPDYRDPITRITALPWTRLHATKDYRDMVEILRPFPRVRCTFNLTPILLEQLDRIASGESDAWLDLARTDASALTASDREALMRNFFSANRERMVDPYPRYRELWRRASESRESGGNGADWSEEDWRDLQVWFHLAWVDPGYATVEPIRGLLAKGRGFTEAEKRALLDWGVALAGTVADAYRAAADSGQIELSVSAFHHPILPLLVNGDAPREASAEIVLPSPPLRAPDDALAQVRRARERHAARFGRTPRGTWPPEGAVTHDVVALLSREGFAWAASDEAVLARALAARGGDPPEWPAALHRPYRVDTPSGSIAMLFRDRGLSDAIGFVYKHWDPEQAARDFLDRVRRAGAALERGRKPAVVTVILDGENCWESYLEDGRPFLNHLYRALQEAPDVEAVTVTEALERSPASESLGVVPVGSWIRDDLGIWIGHAEKNRAWEELRRAREALVARGDGAAAEAWESLYAAEASDWFWWYGDDHVSAQKDVFDALFRAHLANVYACLDLPAPAALRESLRSGPGEDGDRVPPIVEPVLDGRETDFFEWRRAERYDAEASGGAMHQTAGRIGRVLHGTDGRHLLVRVDWTGAARSGGALPGRALRVELEGSPGGPTAVAPLDGPEKGTLAWTGGAEAGALPGDRSALDGTFARGEVVELRIPFARCGAAPGSALAWRVALAAGGLVEETAPREGWFRTRVPPEDLRLVLWSAS